jgi:murein DD-endopeptidase MepM/ murein hydrolase activator NlpD
VFGNPVAGTIRPFGAPSDGTFRVTAPFGVIDASHPTPHGGVDIGNGRCGEPLLAMSNGRITLAGTVPGSDALIIRGIDPAYPDYEWAVAHCATMAVKVGQLVKRGQRIGTLGKTGATACHCHIGLKIKGVSADAWPYLDQNQEDEVLLGTNPQRVTNRFTSTHANTKFRADPSTAKPELRIVPGFTRFEPDFEVSGQVVAGTARWYSGMLTVNGVLMRGYFHESTLVPLQPIEQTDCSAAVTEATRPLMVKIEAARRELA